MNIATTDAQGLFTKKLIDVYRERPTPTAFLRSFFPTGPRDITSSLELSIEVQRGDELIAVDVLRGTDGNRNEISRSTEKIFIPPYFREYFDQTQLQLYDRLFAATEISDEQFASLINSTADHVLLLQEKIERKQELQCAQVLETGIVVLAQGTNIDFKRKAGSLVDLNAAGGYFNTNSDVFAQLQAGCIWLRKNGKTMGQRFNVILGDDAIAALYANTKFLARQDLFNMKLDTVLPPQQNAVGGIYHGTLTAGPYLVDVWSYPQYYKNAAGTLVPYLDAKKGVLLPTNPRFKFAFAATPQLLEPGQAPQTGKFIISQFTDVKARTREFHVESAGVPIPVGVDMIYTMQCLAA
jgi:hypothetical protein